MWGIFKNVFDPNLVIIFREVISKEAAPKYEE